MTRTLFGTDIPDPTTPDPRYAPDGVALFAVAHPRPPLWQRLWFRLFGPHDVCAAALETIDLPEEP